VIGILGTIAYSIRKDRPELNKITAILVLLRSYVPLFDIEERRHGSSELFNSIFFVACLNGAEIQQVINNLIFEKKYSIP